MPALTLHGRTVATVYDLLGQKENDLTYALGWGLANSTRLTRALLDDVAYELGSVPVGDDPEVRLQEYVKGSGYTDVEVRTSALHVIVEAKRGWILPSEEQLSKYAPSLTPGLVGALLVLAEGSPGFAKGRYPETVTGAEGLAVPVVYRSWEQMTKLARAVASGGGAESRLVAEVGRYLQGLVNMQNLRDNMVYVVSLAREPTGWSPISPRDIVLVHGRYFHPIGGPGRWPKEPPNYFGFRFDGELQQVRHVESVDITQTPRDVLPGFTDKYDFDVPHYLYTLGPPIRPMSPVRNGNVRRALRVWAALDLLLTSDTISDARDRTDERLAA